MGFNRDQINTANISFNDFSTRKKNYSSSEENFPKSGSVKLNQAEGQWYKWSSSLKESINSSVWIYPQKENQDSRLVEINLNTDYDAEEMENLS